jgi:Domain of unknown function (DUF4349)
MPDLPDLEALVRATRPVPDPVWAARLDGRAARGFADASPAWYARPFALLRTNVVPAGALAGVLVVAVLVAVTSGGGASHRDSVATNASGGSAASQAAPRAGGTAGAGAASAAPAPRPAPGLSEAGTGGRAVRQDAQLTLTTPVDDLDAVSDGAIRVTDRLGGYVQSSNVNTAVGSASAALELKIPAGQLSDALAQLSRLAHVKARSQAAEDLTDQRSALRAAVADARAERAGLRRRLAAAETDKERASLRAALQRAEHLIVVRQRRVAALNREVAYATVDLAITGTHRHGAAATGGGWTPRDALHDAARVLEVSLGVALVVLAACVPLGLLGGAAALAARLVVRRRREHALDLA